MKNIPNRRRLSAIYKDAERTLDFRLGFRIAMGSAAEFINSHDGHTPRHRLGDLLLHKFNQTNRKKPRLSRNQRANPSWNDLLDALMGFHDVTLNHGYEDRHRDCNLCRIISEAQGVDIRTGKKLKR